MFENDLLTDENYEYSPPLSHEDEEGGDVLDEKHKSLDELEEEEDGDEDSFDDVNLT